MPPNDRVYAHLAVMFQGMFHLREHSLSPSDKMKKVAKPALKITKHFNNTNHLHHLFLCKFIKRLFTGVSVH